MKDYPRKNLRSFGLFSHGGAGKTSVAEAMLFLAGVNSRLGKIMDETSMLDFEPEEKKRKSSIAVALGNLDWNKHQLFLVDTPGDPNFITEARNALGAVDAGIFLVDAVDGVKVLTEKLWQGAKDYGLARAFFISRLDRERADFEATLENVEKTLEIPVCPLSIPIGKEGAFSGVVDLVRMKAYYYPEDGSGRITCRRLWTRSRRRHSGRPGWSGKRENRPSGSVRRRSRNSWRRPASTTARPTPRLP